MAVYWQGPLEDKCNVCSGAFDGVMYDANLGRGWGNVCQKCFNIYGHGLGTGRGQRYEHQQDARWLKTGG